MKKHLSLSLLVLLGACSYFGDETEERLEGERLSLYEFEKTLQSDTNTKFGMDEGQSGANIITLSDSLAGVEDSAIMLDQTWTNQFWPQVGGYPTHAMKHLSFNAGSLKRAWSSSIGRGTTKRTPLTSPPIMADDKIFTLNSDAEVFAFDAVKGKKLWERDVKKPTEDDVVIGGGLAYSGGKLFATNGFNELIALDPQTGKILWRTDTKAPVRAAPSAIPGRVVISTMNNETIAFDAANGKKIWSHRGLSSDAALLGASTPAITRDAVITAYSSGEIYALQIDTGLELWSTNLSPLTRVSGQSSISDIQALPVVLDNVVYSASSKNRMQAIDLRTGQPLWQVALGTTLTPWVSGNRLFVIDTQGTLVSLDKDSGNALWQAGLKQFDGDDRIKWNGPILANNQLIVIGSHGVAQSYSPVDGSLVREWDIADNVILAPAMAKETLYFISDNGTLYAWR